MLGPALHIRVETRIKAPAPLVWEKLSDTSTWPTWNTFVSTAEVQDNAGAIIPSTGGPERLCLNSRRRFQASIRGKKAPSEQKITRFTVPEDGAGGPRTWAVDWVLLGWPSWLLSSLRTNELEEVEVADGVECIYRTGEDQWGPLAYVVNFLLGNDVRKGINDWAEGLKEAAEREYNAAS